MYELSDNIKVYERRDWGAARPHEMDQQSHAHQAFLHHSADSDARKVDTLEEQKAVMRSIQRSHMQGNGWADIGYHYVVFQPYGNINYARIFEGRLTHNVPAAQKDHNTGTIAICMFGDGEHDVIKRNTRYAIELLLTRKPNKTGIRDLRTLGGHRDVVATACPGDHLYAQIPRIAAASDLKVFK